MRLPALRQSSHLLVRNSYFLQVCVSQDTNT